MDSSDVYPLGGGLERAGRTEEIIGRWIKGKRHDWVIATKCFGATGPLPFHAGNNRRHIFDAVDASLRRLGTDYIDLYQLHGFDPQCDGRRNARRARRSGPRRQGALHRLLESPRRIRWRVRWAAAMRADGRASFRCSRATTCFIARSSASCCLCARRRAWA